MTVKLTQPDFLLYLWQTSDANSAEDFDFPKFLSDQYRRDTVLQMD